MTHAFQRTGDLKDIGSYPLWLQGVVRETRQYKTRVVGHELFVLMRDACLPLPAMRRFLIGLWPTIERFPRFMAINLKKAGHGHSRGEDMARHYLVHNIRVEQKHADQWIAWSHAAGLTRDDLRNAAQIEGLEALAHWCWSVSERAGLAAGIAATNYAIEGATGEAACLICSTAAYAESIPEPIRAPAMRWLRLHAQYDDAHPWEALDVVATLLGHNPGEERIDEIRRAIRSSYVYFAMALDDAMSAPLHGFEETASNASTLGVLNAA